jgi:hypothetical protein
MNLFKKLCEQNQEWKYTYLRGKFDYSQRNKLRREKLHEGTVEAHATSIPPLRDTKPPGHCNFLGFDPPNARRKRGRWD